MKHEFLGYSENYPEDLLFNVKNLKYVNKGFFLDEPLYIYNRMNMHSSTVTLPFDVKFDGNNKLMDLLDDELSGEVELEAALMNRKVLRALNLMITLVNDDRMLEEKITLSKQLCYKISTSIDHKKWKSSIKYLGLFRFYYYFGALKENYRLLYFMTWVVVKIKDFKNGK